MSADAPPQQGASLTFHGPVTDERADRLLGVLAARDPATVVDYGCGWAEWLLRLGAAVPGATGVGLDTYAPDLARGRAAAEACGLAERVDLRQQEGSTYDGSADALLCLGSSQVFGPIPEALVALRERVAPGGRVLFGDGFWEREPTEAELARMWGDASADDQTDLATLVGQAEAAGFTVLGVETANRDEWEAFESGFLVDEVTWAADHPEHPRSAEILDHAAAFRSRFLAGYRGILGFAYLTLAPR